MDSTSIAATAYKLMTATGSPVDFRAYASFYKQVIADEEGDYAALVAEAAGFPIEYLVVEDYWQQPPIEQPEYIESEPLLIRNQSVEMELNRRVAGHSRVLLAGFGGDPALYPAPYSQNKSLMLNPLGYIRSLRARVRLRTRLRQWLRIEQQGRFGSAHREQQKIYFPDWFNQISQNERT